MNKKVVWAILFVILVAFTAATALAQEKAKPEEPIIQKYCFMTKDVPVKRNIYVDYIGHRIYFCSEDCQDEFYEHPGRYFKHMQEEKFVLGKTPVVK